MFLLQVGRGGAGPAYGIFDLGEMDDGFEHKAWSEDNGFVGKLREFFPHTSAWNDLIGCPDDKLVETDEDEYERQLNEFEERYWAQLDGAIPICHLGCAYRQWLIVSGSERGHIWCDDRTDQKGLYPLSKPGNDRITFYDWYRDWLDEALAGNDIEAEQASGQEPPARSESKAE